MDQFKPRWVFEQWCDGAGCKIVARDKDLPMRPFERQYWLVKGYIKQWLFGWWWQAHTDDEMIAAMDKPEPF